MSKFSPRERAQLRALMEQETVRLDKDAQNMLPPEQFRSEYPRMMYRQTEEEDRHVITTHPDGRPREVTIVNKFGPFLCETTIAEDADEAEALLSTGWDITPSAAYGQVSAAAQAVTAKDTEIEALRAELAALRSASGGDAADRPRRGRPPKISEETLADADTE